MDMLSTDGWNEMDAIYHCEWIDENGYPPFSIVDESGSCKNTVDQANFTKRCNACETGRYDTSPFSCLGRPYYYYGPTAYPDAICTTFQDGIVEEPPWPDY